jgi:proteasome lid subunit RPN8/RPN11
MEHMCSEVSSNIHEEACGLLAGRIESGNYTVMKVIPVANELHSPVRYRMEPQEQIDAFNLIEAQGLELVGIYHSHPAGPPAPSMTDIAEAYYPEAAYLVWFSSAGEWQCRAYRIRDGWVTPLEMFIY